MLRLLLITVGAWTCLAQVAAACPFCTALRPTLSQRRESASVVALGECTKVATEATDFRVHRVERGQQWLGDRSTLTLSVDVVLKPGTLALLFADAETETPLAQWRWTAVAVNETSLGYFLAAPALNQSASQRLRYFARYLEHPEGLVAEDAWQEFGHAPYDEVGQVADALPSDKLRGWLTDPAVPQERKGFYGLAVGLTSPGPRRAETVEFLRKLVLEPADDFRTGFDGIVAGYLIAGQVDALQVVENRFLANANAADGDVRHVVSALRFYEEFGQGIPQPRLNAAMRHLLERPEFAASAIVDLARWRDWTPAPRIAELYLADPPPGPATRRAIVGYLLACPADQGAELLARLRRLDPRGVEQAIGSLALPLGLAANE